MKDKKLKVGVVGLGMGGWHAATYKTMPQAELIAICDTDAGWLKLKQQEWEVPHIFTSIEKMLAMPELEAVSIAVPNFLHKPMTLAAIKAGKHVLIEKPMALNAVEGEEMNTAAKKHRRTLMVSHNQRFGADIQFLKRYIDAGHMGEIYFARTLWRRPLGMLPDPVSNRPSGAYKGHNWFNERAKGGGVCRDLGTHVIDIALALMGFPELDYCVGSTYTKFIPGFLKGTGFKGDAEDHCSGYAKFKNGASLQIETSFGQHIDKEEIKTELFGTKGGACRHIGQDLHIFSQVGDTYTTITPRLIESSFSVQVEFVNSILEGRPALITPEEAIAVLRVIDGIYGVAPEKKSAKKK
jgi:predicted dehydrogenase